MSRANSKRGKADGSDTTLSGAQRRYLSRGVDQAGGKLPLFDENGREFDLRTIQSCIRAGWAEPWFANPLKPDWLVCKLTDKGRNAVGDGG
jgi:hypothetical protein